MAGLAFFPNTTTEDSRTIEFYTVYSEMFGTIFISLVKQIREILCPKKSLFLYIINVKSLKFANLNMLKICKIMDSRNIKCANITRYTF